MNGMPTRICLIDDDPVMGEALSLRLELEGHTCDWFKLGQPAIQAIGKGGYHAVICDIQLPDISGEEIFHSLREEGRAMTPFIFITGFGNVDQAVRLIKQGAADYLIKPFDPDTLLDKLGLLRGTLKIAPDHAEPLGPSPAMVFLDHLLARIGPTQSSVLITGESGVGKERIARKLHVLGRPEQPFVAVNCGALSETLLEAELFGYEKGAFTGANKTKHGLFEQAHDGTLFLDEISETSPAMQVKLLRVIEERQVIRVGGETGIGVDFRLVAASNQDIKNLVEDGRFRQDLYFRLNVIQLRVPPLRERLDDIPWLAERFLNVCAAHRSRVPKRLSPAARQALQQYPWPGNVRELKHLLERACVLTDGQVLGPNDLFDKPPASLAPDLANAKLGDYLNECERAYICQALHEQDWRIQETANRLGISRKGLWEKMKKLAISRNGEAVRAD
ncbi:MAG: sigma-54 dependent transcriptional regulator [Gallionellaceae bacterium]|nr:sigma-54 dependent transcriptional regulator [Gallionellaceae bacterium]